MKSSLLLIIMMILPLSVMANDATLATVNGKPIKQSLLTAIEEEAKDQGQKIDDNTREAILNQLIQTEIIIQKAQSLGLDKKPSFLTKKELISRNLLIDSFIQDYVKAHPISEEDLKSAYEKYKTELGDKEYQARHILVENENDAKEIIAQLGKNGDFAKISKEKSKDPGSKDKGGELGWFSLANMVKPFSDALAKLQKGAVTQEPVKTQFGWHIIKLDDVRDFKTPPYDKVKEVLQRQLSQRQLEKMMMELRNKASVVMNKKNSK